MKGIDRITTALAMYELEARNEGRPVQHYFHSTMYGTPSACGTVRFGLIERPPEGIPVLCANCTEAETSPIVAQLVERMEHAFTEVTLAAGTPALHAMAKRFHRYADLVRDLTGCDPVPAYLINDTALAH